MSNIAEKCAVVLITKIESGTFLYSTNNLYGSRLISETHFQKLVEYMVVSIRKNQKLSARSHSACK